MAIVSRIIHKLGIGVPATDDLEVGELAQDRATGDLYGKTDDGNVFKVGTAGDGDAGYDDTEIRADLAQEVDDREAGDLALDGKITVEIADREAGDTALSGRVDAEVADRIAGDANLQDQIDALGTGGDGYDDSEIKADLAQETQDRIDGDSALQAQINNLPDGDCNIPILDSPPVNPELGEQWFSSTDGYLYIWYGAEWVAIGGAGGSGGDIDPGPDGEEFWDDVEVQMRFFSSEDPKLEDTGKYPPIYSNCGDPTLFSAVYGSYAQPFTGAGTNRLNFSGWADGGGQSLSHP